MLLMGVAHAVITVKGTHLASHGALSESQAWGDFWAVFFIEVKCSEINCSALILTCSSVLINAAADVPFSKPSSLCTTIKQVYLNLHSDFRRGKMKPQLAAC